MSKVISRLLWFCITTFCDWLKATRATFSTNGNPNQNQSCFGRTRFPALGTGYTYLLRILIGSSCCLHLLRLVRVVTLVLVLLYALKSAQISNFRTELSIQDYVQQSFLLRKNTSRNSSFEELTRKKATERQVIFAPDTLVLF